MRMQVGTDQVQGTFVVQRVRFSGQDGFAIVDAEPINGGPRVALKGRMDHVVRGSLVEVDGRLVRDPKWGEQVQVRVATVLPPQDKDGAAIYLAGAPGLGEVGARKLVAQLDDQLWAVVEEGGERLAAALRKAQHCSHEVAADKAASISAWCLERRHQRETVTALARWGLTRVQINTTLQVLQADATIGGCTIEALVQRNPWRLAEDVDGVGLGTCDEIAARLRKDPNCVDRARAVVLEVLGADGREGHCYAFDQELVARCARSVSIERVLIEHAICALELDGKLVVEGGRVYRAQMHRAEATIAGHVVARLQPYEEIAVEDLRVQINEAAEQAEVVY